ncbi:hypothetical protein IG631_04122 [Alternaria alternata]|nr:hypothetical protein IG631_04122 [Alternaria alternata]
MALPRCAPEGASAVLFGGMAPHRGCEPDVPGPISGDLSRQPMTRLPRSMAVSRFRHGGADQRSMAIGACGRASASHSGRRWDTKKTCW